MGFLALQVPVRRLVALGGGAILAGSLAATTTTAGGGGLRATLSAHPAVAPTLADAQFVRAGSTPPTEAQCNSVGRRCFNPDAIHNSYNMGPLYAAGNMGQGQTIAIVDSFGSQPIRHDLHVFDSAFGLQPMCGEEGVSCAGGMPSFSILHVQGSPPPVPAPLQRNSTGQEAHDLWSGEVTLDVEWAHAVAPMANIILVTTPTAETLGVQGLPQMMNAEQFVIDHHLANVISQSFATAEEAFHSTQSLLNLRHAYVSAAASGVTALAASGDSGTANIVKEPVKNPALIPFPTVEWPASDPLVTGVGGTYLCTDGQTGTTVDSAPPPAACAANPGQREVGWIASGGGFSHVFSRPGYQDTLPAGSTPIRSQRGVPDVAYQASSRSGILVYDTEPPVSGVVCSGSQPCPTAGWYVFGGTSIGTPQWAGLVAIADQMNGAGLGLINPGLYRIGADPARYHNDFFDVTTGNNQLDPSVPGYPATTGWDPVTGLGTPNAANLVPDLIAAVHGH